MSEMFLSKTTSEPLQTIFDKGTKVGEELYIASIVTNIYESTFKFDYIWLNDL
jgi:hypothetical protein